MNPPQSTILFFLVSTFSSMSLFVRGMSGTFLSQFACVFISSSESTCLAPTTAAMMTDDILSPNDTTLSSASTATFPASFICSYSVASSLSSPPIFVFTSPAPPDSTPLITLSCLFFISDNPSSYPPATASFAVLISRFVMPPRAETTTTNSACSPATMFLTLFMLSTVPTDVPPNFITFIL